MKIDFRLRRQTTLRPIITTEAQANSLARLYLAIPRIWTEATPRILESYSRSLSEMTRDDIGDVEYQIGETDSLVVRAILSFRESFMDWALGMDMWHFNRFVANLKYATNVDMGSILGPTPRDTLQAVLARNVALVSSVSDQTRERIQDIVFRGLTNRTPIRDVAKEISEATGLARARARRIASDQTVKISAAMDEQRMREVGIDKFRWNHSGKRHFRPEHKARDGIVYSWDDPIIKNDKPGFAPFCGCKARGVIEGSG